MTSKAEKKMMIEYLVSKLSDYNQRAEPVTNAFGDLKADYIRVGDKGIVFLVDKTYAKPLKKNSFDKRVHPFERFQKMSQINGNIMAYVFYKDGETFFRSAAKVQGYKKDDQGLKKYSNEEIYRMIEFRPEEILIREKSPWLQYYQPKSDNLEESIVTYKFEPVSFDHSDLTINKIRWKYPERSDEELRAILSNIPDEHKSKRVFIWDEKSKDENSGSLKLGYNDNLNALLISNKILDKN